MRRVIVYVIGVTAGPALALGLGGKADSLARLATGASPRQATSPAPPRLGRDGGRRARPAHRAVRVVPGVSARGRGRLRLAVRAPACGGRPVDDHPARRAGRTDAFLGSLIHAGQATAGYVPGHLRARSEYVLLARDLG